MIAPAGSETAMDWAAFEKNLFDQFVTLPERVVCIIGHGEDFEHFVQFAGIQAFEHVGMKITVGFQDDTRLARKFTAEEEALFRECGFRREGEGPTYWEQHLTWPPTGQALAKVLKAFLTRLRDVPAAPSPDTLVYKAWQHAGYGIGQHREKWYVGGPNYSLDQLGLRMIRS